MDQLSQTIGAWSDTLRGLGVELFSIWVLVQVGLLVVAYLLATGISALIRRRADVAAMTLEWPVFLRLVLETLFDHLGLILFAIIAGSMRAELLRFAAPRDSYLLGAAASLATAWVVIAVIARVIRNRFVYRLVAISAWTIAALNILGLLTPVSEALDSVALTLGGMRITPLLVLKTCVFLGIALWLASSVGDFFDRRLHTFRDLTPSVQVLLAKLMRIGLITLAILIVASSAGIDLSAFAIFSGAVGVGVGFGLQKIVSNLVSGIILLADKSIKPGDVISVGESFGWVTTMGARYTAVISRDGREFLIPNEDFVTTRVVNWSYTKNDVRFNVDFGVDVVADPHHVRRVALAAIKTVPRVLAKPEPSCHFMAFGSKSLDFSLRFWINDPTDGATNVKSAVLLALWDAFKREAIPIPPPVQDLRMVAPVRVETAAPPD